MLKKKILGNKVMSLIRGGASCFDPGNGCTCVASENNVKFIANSNVWLDAMDKDANRKDL